NVRRSHLPSPIDNASSSSSHTGRRIVALLAPAALHNYNDRGNLFIASSLLKDELKLSASQLGILLSSFFWTYSLFLPVSGWLADRFDAKWVMAFGFFLWSGATAVTGGLHAFGALLAARLILGMESPSPIPATHGRWCVTFRKWAVDSQTHLSLLEWVAVRLWELFSAGL